MCASEMIEHRKNSWELYGFDFMIDENFNAWLIEINSSPACDYSTKVTDRYVQKALVELLDVVIDPHTTFPTLQTTSSSSNKQSHSEPVLKRSKPKKGEKLGGWEQVYSGPLLDLPIGAFGTEMSLKGERIQSIPLKKRVVAPTLPSFLSSDSAQPRSKPSLPHQSKSQSSKQSNLRNSKNLGENNTDSDDHYGIDETSRSSSSRVKNSKQKAISSGKSDVSSINGGKENLFENYEDFDDSDNEEDIVVANSLSPTSPDQLQMTSEDHIAQTSINNPTSSTNPVHPPPNKKKQDEKGQPKMSIPIKVLSLDF